MRRPAWSRRLRQFGTSSYRRGSRPTSRAGIAHLDYNSWQLSAEPNGTAWFVDTELGWRRERFSVSAFSSYLYAPLNGTGSSDVGDTTWNVGFHVIEVGLRATLHFGRFSFGLGLMPLVLARATGSATTYEQCPNVGMGYTPVPVTGTYTSWDTLGGLEVHAAYDLGALAGVPVQVFAVLDAAQSYAGGDYNTMTTARLGLGARL